MDTSRIIINAYDNSTSITESATEITGFTVVKAEKGPCTPIRISAGGTTARKDTFGSSSKTYPEMFEVETFNNQYDCWISAPYTSATVPAAIICEDKENKVCITEKTEPITYTFDMEKEILGLSGSETSVFDIYSETACACKTTKGDTTSVSCNCIKALIIPKYPSANRKLHITVTPVSNTKDPNRMTISAWEEGSGHTKSNPVTISGSLDPYAKNAGGSYIGFSDLNSDYANQNLFYVHVFNKFELAEGSTNEWEVSPITNTVDIALEGGTREFTNVEYEECDETATAEKGKVYYSCTPNKTYSIVDVIKGNSVKDYYTLNDEGTYTLCNGDATADGSTTYYKGTSNDTYFVKSVEVGKSVAGLYTKKVDNSISAIDNHAQGWEEVENGDYSDVNIFFDCRRHSGNNVITKDTFISIAKTHPYQGFIFNETPTEDNETFISTLSPLNYGRNCWNTCNEAIVVLDNGDKIISTLVGARAAMQCRIIENRFGGVAPMWLNTSGMGGQLSVSIFKMLHKYSKNALTKLDEFNYNPVINDRQYGLMCVGQKTCVNGEATDWSYIGHACSFMTFIREVRDTVMIQQIGKPNNPYYRELRRDQVMRLLKQRLEGNNRIWAEGVVDTSTNDGVNDVYNRKKRCFVINVRVKVDIYSEYVILNFTNEDQATTITVSEGSES